MKQFSWIKKPVNEELYSTIRETFEHSDDFCKLLASRGFQNVEEVKEFLNPIVGEKVSRDEQELTQLEKAKETILNQIKNEGWIVIHGDYDVDGISATTILFDFLYYQLGHKKVIPYIPSRLDEGYGISEGSLESIQDMLHRRNDGPPLSEERGINNLRIPLSPLRVPRGAALERVGQLRGHLAGVCPEALVISVDCGVKETSLIDDKWYKVFDFIITDHHSLKVEDGAVQLSKKAKAIIHPQVEGSGFEFKEVCGTVVVYRLIEYVWGSLKLEQLQDTPYPLKSQSRFEGEQPMQQLPLNPDSDNYFIGIEGVGSVLQRYLPFLSLATNCDIMPLVGENRILMKRGLESFKNLDNLGLNKLIDFTGLDKNKITPYHLGFVLGPHINAAGRIGNALDAVKLFVTTDESLSEELAEKLLELNSTRQDITMARMILAEKEAKKQLNEKNKILVIVGENWEEGIIGLCAGKLCEKFHLPTIVISIGQYEAVGSCRSLAKINITEILAKHSDLLLRFGGHTQAAGLRLDKDKVEKFQSAITKYCNKNLSDEDIKKNISIDLELSDESISEEFLDELALLEPHGMGNPKPNFLFENFVVENCFPLGKESRHIKIRVSKGDVDTTVVGFNVEKKLFTLTPGDQINIVGNLDLNEYNGQRSVQILLKDIEVL